MERKMLKRAEKWAISIFLSEILFISSVSFLKSPRCFLNIFENSDFFVTKYEVFSTITSRILNEEFIDATFQ